MRPVLERIEWFRAQYEDGRRGGQWDDRRCAAAQGPIADD